MALNVSGLEKIVIDPSNTEGGAVTISGNDLSADFGFALEKITRSSSRGTTSTTGNKSYDFTFNCYDFGEKSNIEAKENKFTPMEFYVLGNTTATPDLTIEDVNPIVDEFVNTDPTSEDGGYFQVKCSGTIPNS